MSPFSSAQGSRAFDTRRVRLHPLTTQQFVMGERCLSFSSRVPAPPRPRHPGASPSAAAAWRRPVERAVPVTSPQEMHAQFFQTRQVRDPLHGCQRSCIGRTEAVGALDEHQLLRFGQGFSSLSLGDANGLALFQDGLVSDGFLYAQDPLQQRVASSRGQRKPIRTSVAAHTLPASRRSRRWLSRWFSWAARTRIILVSSKRWLGGGRPGRRWPASSTRLAVIPPAPGACCRPGRRARASPHRSRRKAGRAGECPSSPSNRLPVRCS